jgi:hypothetical protein
MNRSSATATPICGGVGVPRARANISIASELDASIRPRPECNEEEVRGLGQPATFQLGPGLEPTAAEPIKLVPFISQIAA